ncbi:hypothetical protein CEXT_634691 [Caerostris extrusa]|uniref:Uncharacterized protein n=1 Tax=Caerostris extrusa TaxID=172846 RepID=A0AAV4RRV7_CAEEX|nr:hypothetical protein CEXT_634691 [Caerostris extrusa]
MKTCQVGEIFVPTTTHTHCTEENRCSAFKCMLIKKEKNNNNNKKSFWKCSLMSPVIVETPSIFDLFALAKTNSDAYRAVRRERSSVVFLPPNNG